MIQNHAMMMPRSRCAASLLLRITLLAGVITGLVGPMAAPAGGPLPEVLVDPEVLAGEASEPDDDHATLQPRVEKFRYRDGPAMELTGDREFRGGVVVDGGRIVLIPRTGEFIAEYDPGTGRMTRTARHGQPGGFGFGSVIDGTLVVMTPRGSRNIGLYDSKTQQYRDGAAHGQASNNAFLGSAMVRPDLVVFAPLNARGVGLYDPTTRTFTKGPEHGEEAAAFMAAQRCPNGPVVMAPYRASHVGIYDPSSGQYRSGPSVAHVPVLSHGQRFSGAILTASGDQIIMSNRGADRLGIIEAAEEIDRDTHKCNKTGT